MNLKGKCMAMCPFKEFRFRKQHHLLHTLEFSDAASENYETVDNQFCVKEFRRSAAGENISDVECLRPSSVLLQTLDYLLKTVLHRKCSFTVKYDFIFDRLRSIRQDAVIQRLEAIDPNTLILVLQACVRFYFYAAYKAKKDSHQNIDLHINDTHLSDCLRWLFELYCTSNSTLLRNSKEMDCDSTIAAYILINIQTTEVMNSVFKGCPNLLQNDDLLRDAVFMYLSYQNNNFLRFNKLVHKLINKKSYLVLFAIFQFVDDMRIDVAKLLCNSHHSKVCSFDANDLCKWWLMSSVNGVLQYSKELGLAICNNDSVKFMKSSLPFQANVTSHSNACIVSETLCVLQNTKLSNFLLGN